MSQKKGIKLPHIGMRMIKTAVAVWIILLFYTFFEWGRTAFYAVIAAILCVQSDLSDSRDAAMNRILGTLIGAFYGALLLVIQHKVLWIRHPIPDTLLVTFGCMLTIYTVVSLKRPGMAFIGCVAFSSIVIAHRGDVNPYIFIWYRVSDTILGILVAYGVNWFHLPKRRDTETLYISGLDHVLIGSSRRMSSYSTVSLNRMIGHGLQFTLATYRTPASVIPILRDIHLNLPVIAMDGAVVYDVERNCYIKEANIRYEDACQVEELLIRQDMAYYTNLLIEDVFLIFYSEFRDGIQKQFYDRLRKSPYRNYIRGGLPENRDILYFSVLDKPERLERLKAELKALPVFSKLRIWEKDEVLEGYSFLKIYSREATKKQMVEWLREYCGAETLRLFDIDEKQSDHPLDLNQAVRQIHKEFEPVRRKME